MLGVQQELSRAIAAQIQLRLSPSAEAYDLYLQGRRLWNQFTPPTTRKAMEYDTRATEIDHDHTLASAGLASA